jgi:Phage portal protein, SPP1 Gp6-like
MGANMAYQLEPLGLLSTGNEKIENCLSRLIESERPRYKRLWTYFANPMFPRRHDAHESGSGRPYLQGQEWGLPPRITGMIGPFNVATTQNLISSIKRKEVVIENDIGWRINTMVEFLFGRELGIESGAPDPQRQQLLTAVLRQVLANHGGILFLQQLALLGFIYGFVDVLVKLDTSRLAEAVSQTVDAPPPPRELGGDPGGVGEGSSGDGHLSPLPSSDAGAGTASGVISNTGGGTSVPLKIDIEKIAGLIRLEIVDPSRSMPVLSDIDWRAVEAYAQIWEEPGTATGEKGGFLSQWLRSSFNRITPPADATVMEIISPTAWQRYQNGTLISQGINSLGEIPLVHIQNSTLPFSYTGASEVEPLIPLQDELNTRMSDRANRITMQSFKMYLGKGVDGFLDMPVGPGRMWSTDNDQANVIEFGGDSDCPNETAHIEDIREALDKTSSVSAIAAGSVKSRIGNLTSAAALRITLMALLSKNERKRTNYGKGIARICELILAWLDTCGALPNKPEERAVNLYWPDPLPGDEMESIQEAQAKLNLGVPKEVVLKELGY